MCPGSLEDGAVLSDECVKAACMKKARFDLSLKRYIGFEKQENNIFSLIRLREPDKQRPQ